MKNPPWRVFFMVRPAWAHTCGCKSCCELVILSKVKRNCVRVSERGKEAWSINREPMNKNRISFPGRAKYHLAALTLGGVGWGRLCILLISCTSVVILVIDQDRIAILNPERQAPIAADHYRPAPSKPSRQRMKPPAWQIHVPWRLSPVQLRQLPRQPSRIHHLDAGLCSLLKKASIPLSRGTRSVSKRNKPASSCKPWTPNRTRPSLTWATGRWTRPTPTSTSSTVANSRV